MVIPGNRRRKLRPVMGRSVLARGFTLIELMIGLALVSTLLGIGVPMFGEFIKDQRAKSTSSDLSVALLLARSEAVKRNTQITLEPAGDGDDWSVGWVIESPNEGEPDILNHVQPGDILITEATDQFEIRFSPTGRTPDPAQFEINVDTEVSDVCRVVTLALDGKTNSVKQDCSEI